MDINIVIPVYRRLESFSRLMASLSEVRSSGMIHLLISCDGGASDEVLNFARTLKWTRGTFKVIEHTENLGINHHNFWCIEQAKDLGHALILEDDLYIAPNAIEYLQSVIPLLGQGARIGGIALYRYMFNESTHFPFQLIPEKYTNFYQQRICSKGVYYTSEMADECLSFVRTFDKNYSKYSLPPNVTKWKDNSWEKILYCYLIEKDKYLIFPTYSLTTDFADPGIHMNKESEQYVHQSALYLSSEFIAADLLETLNVYDSHYEIKSDKLQSVNQSLKPHDFEVDLYGLKDLTKYGDKLVLSSKISDKSLMTWGQKMKPETSNLIFNNPGNYYSLAPASSFRSRNRIAKRRHDYLYYFPDSKLMDLLRMKWSEIVSRFIS